MRQSPHLFCALLIVLRGGLAGLLVVSCSKDHRKPPTSSTPPAPSGPPFASMTTAQATRGSFPAPTLRGRVFIDTSGSMQGFFGTTRGRAASRAAVAAVHDEL